MKNKTLQWFFANHLVKMMLLLLFLAGTSAAAQAQQTVTGIVTDAAGEPVIGATVAQKGTSNNGTITDLDGHFSLKVPANSTLVISYIGYKTQEVALKNQTSVKVTMQEDAEILDEVVVVGYGTQKKATLSGSVTQVRGEEVLKGKATTSVAAALQGEIPGLTITRSSSRPGNESTSITLRGGISVNSVDPMIVIDGVDSYQWELSQINPADIENISVLKDAAAAIYGTRAAGGVILITTKRGKEGKTKVTYNGSVHANVLGKRFPVATGQEWACMMNEAINNDAVANGTKTYWMFNEDQLNKLMNNEAFTEVINMGKGNMTHVDPTADQFAAIYGTTWGHSHNVSINGGSDKVKAMVSLGYADDRSLLTAAYDGQKKYNFRTNIDYQLHKNVKVEFNLSYDNRTVSTPTQGVGQGLQDFYVFPLYNDQGQYYDVFGKNNVLAKLKEGGTTTNKEEILRLGGKITFDLGFLTKGLSVTANANIRDRKGLRKERATTVTMYDWSTHDVYDSNGNITQSGVEGGPLGLQDNIFSQTASGDLYMKRRDQRTLYKSYGAFMNYMRSFAAHNISFMGGVTAEKQDYESLTAKRKNMIDDSLDNLATGDATTTELSDLDESDWGMVSLLARLNYDYKGIYLLEGQFRRDGSSKLSKENRWANFAGISGGIRFSEFEFVKQWNVFDNLKLRASYGELGSLSGIGNYDYISSISTGTTVFGPNGEKANTAWVNGVTTDKRSWERVASTNIALDFAVLKNRLSGSFEWFFRQNKGMLIAMTYPQVFGAGAPKTNDGNFEAKGWELTLKWADKIGKDFNYSIGLNLWDDRTEVTEYNGAIAIKNGKNSVIEGKPLNSLYVYKTDGYLQNEAEVEAYYKQVSGQGSKIPVYQDANGNYSNNRLTPGCVRKVDLDKDGAITEEDLYYYGDANPHYMFGVTLGASYKGFDFNMFIQGVGQQYIVREGYLSNPFNAGYTNQNSTFLGKTWSETNTNALYPVMSRNGSRNNWNYKWINDINVSNCWYARAKNIVLGYTLPKTLLQKAGIENLRLYLSADNLFEFSNVIDGFDPESKAATSQGNMDVFARTISFGIDLTF